MAVLLAGAACQVDLTGKNRCRGDDDCLGGLACNRTDSEGLCLAPTSDGRFQCQSDPDCLTTQSCFAGLCAALCTAAAPCAQGECRVPSGQDQGSGLCGMGRLTDPCLRASDCGPSLFPWASGANQRCVVVRDRIGACEPDDGSELAVLSFALVEAPSGRVLVEQLAPGQTIDFSLPQNKSISVMAITRPERLGSVVFDTDGKRTGVESVPPYYLAGNTTVTGVAAWRPEWRPSPSLRTIRATGHASMDGTGRSGTSLELEVKVVGY